MRVAIRFEDTTVGTFEVVDFMQSTGEYYFRDKIFKVGQGTILFTVADKDNTEILVYIGSPMEAEKACLTLMQYGYIDLTKKAALYNPDEEEDDDLNWLSSHFSWSDNGGSDLSAGASILGGIENEYGGYNYK